MRCVARFGTICTIYSVSHFSTPLKRQKSFSLLVFLWGIEMENWPKIGKGV